MKFQATVFAIVFAFGLVVGDEIRDAWAQCAMTEVYNPYQTPASVPVSSLPACTAQATGNVAVVTNALLPVLGSLVAGGGTISVVVRCNGTQWNIGQ